MCIRNLCCTIRIFLYQKVPATHVLSSPSGAAEEDNVEDRQYYFVRTLINNRATEPELPKVMGRYVTLRHGHLDRETCHLKYYFRLGKTRCEFCLAPPGVEDNVLREYQFVGTLTNNRAGMAGDGRRTTDGQQGKDQQIFLGKYILFQIMELIDCAKYK